MADVLVVDDSPVDRRLLGRLVEKVPNVTADYAVDGRDALKRVEERIPDLVVTDLQMPEMDGLELVETLKSRYPQIPVILVTAAGSEAIAVRALSAGAASYVSKAAQPEDLVETVGRLLVLAGVAKKQSRLKGCIHRSETEYVLDNDRDLIMTLAVHLREQLKEMKICPDAEGLRTGVALEEALLNAYYHGNLEVSSQLKDSDWDAFGLLAEQRCRETPYKDRRIFVSSILSPAEAVWVIRDEGNGFNVDDLPDPTEPKYLERAHGRGLLLMKTFMDEVVFNRKGNEVRLVKRKTNDSEGD